MDILFLIGPILHLSITQMINYLININNTCLRECTQSYRLMDFEYLRIYITDIPFILLKHNSIFKLTLVTYRVILDFLLN